MVNGIIPVICCSASAFALRLCDGSEAAGDALPLACQLTGNLSRCFLREGKPWVLGSKCEAGSAEVQFGGVAACLA